MNQAHDAFYVKKVITYESQEEADAVEFENTAVKSALNLLIQQLKDQRDGKLVATKIAIEEKVKKRVEEEVEELLADEQRSTVMGTWA